MTKKGEYIMIKYFRFYFQVVKTRIYFKKLMVLLYDIRKLNPKVSLLVYIEIQARKDECT